MAISLKHAFNSAKADGTDSTLVQPSNWNAEHTLTLAGARLLGRGAAGNGAAEEIAVSARFALTTGNLDLSDGALSADAAGRAKMADGFLSADAAGRAKMADGFLTVSKINATGTPSATTFLRGDGSWAAPDAIPAGTVIWFAANAAPTGYLKANGAAVSRTTYAALFSAIGTTFGVGDGSTTFNLPDLRGEFIRGWDDGRGIDTARAFGSAQSGQNAAHTHTGTTDSSGSHNHTMNPSLNVGSSGAVATGAVSDAGLNSFASALTTTSAGAHTHTFTTASSGGTEARPRNVALLACIKF